MTGRTPCSKTRRLVRVIAIAAVLAATCGFSGGNDGQGGGQGGGQISPPGGGQDQAPVGTVVMIIRHGEKPDGAAGGPGMDAFGKPDDSSLTQAGYARASALADLFAPAQSWPRPGVVVPRAIYAAGANSDGEGLRTRQTVAPLAQRLGLPVNTDFGKGDEQKLVARIVTEPGPTLICWQQARSRRSCRRSSRSPRCRRRCGRTRATT